MSLLLLYLFVNLLLDLGRHLALRFMIGILRYVVLAIVVIGVYSLLFLELQLDDVVTRCFGVVVIPGGGVVLIRVVVVETVEVGVHLGLLLEVTLLGLHRLTHLKFVHFLGELLGRGLRVDIEEVVVLIEAGVPLDPRGRGLVVQKGVVCQVTLLIDIVILTYILEYIVDGELEVVVAK